MRPRCETLSPKVHLVALIFMLPITALLMLALIAATFLSIGMCNANAVPVLGFGAFVSFLYLFPATIYGIAWSAYLLRAQQDRPPYALVGTPALARLVPFLPLSPIRCAKVAKAALNYLGLCLRYAPLVKDWLLNSVYYTKPHERDLIYDAIPYAVPFSNQFLDVYPPLKPCETAQGFNTDLSRHGTYQGAPVLVLIPSPILPVRLFSRRKAYLQLVSKLRAMGFCVVVPDIRYYPEVRIRDSVGDLRFALSWVGAHISSYGGNPAAIYTLGFGLSAHLITLTLVQEAVALSHTVAFHAVASVGMEDSKSELEKHQFKNLEIYLPQVRLPQLAGVVLVAGLSDVIKGYRLEMKQGIEHLSYLRRFVGPSHAQCLLHSPVHLLMEKKSIIEPSFLPNKFLLIHGGKDQTIPLYHSSLLKTLLSESGVGEVKLRAYRNLGHFEALACLATSTSPYAKQIMADLREFIS